MEFHSWVSSLKRPIFRFVFGVKWVLSTAFKIAIEETGKVFVALARTGLSSIRTLDVVFMPVVLLGYFGILTIRFGLFVVFAASHDFEQLMCECFYYLYGGDPLESVKKEARKAFDACVQEGMVHARCIDGTFSEAAPVVNGVFIAGIFGILYLTEIAVKRNFSV